MSVRHRKHKDLSVKGAVNNGEWKLAQNVSPVLR